MSTLYDDLVAAGIEVDHHESDLYVRLDGTNRATKILMAHGRPGKAFRSAKDGKVWVEVPFAYQPFWDAVSKRSSASIGPDGKSPEFSILPNEGGGS